MVSRRARLTICRGLVPVVRGGEGKDWCVWSDGAYARRVGYVHLVRLNQIDSPSVALGYEHHDRSTASSDIIWNMDYTFMMMVTLNYSLIALPCVL